MTEMTPMTLRKWAEHASNSGRGDQDFTVPFAAADAWKHVIVEKGLAVGLWRSAEAENDTLRKRLEQQEAELSIFGKWLVALAKEVKP